MHPISRREILGIINSRLILKSTVLWQGSPFSQYFMENYNPNGGGWQDALFQRDPRLDPRNFIPGQMQVQAMQNQSYHQQPYPVHRQLTTSHTWRNNVASTHPNHPSPYCNNLQAFSGNKSTPGVPLVQVPTYPHYCNQVLPTLHQFESTHSNVGPGPGSHLDGLHEQGPSSIIKRVPLVPLNSNTLHVSRKSTSEQPTRGKPTTQALIRKALSGFFAENQSVGLRPYCRANNMASNHASIYLIVRNNDTLKVLIGKQGKGGFDRRISRAALRVVNVTGEKTYHKMERILLRRSNVLAWITRGLLNFSLMIR